MPDEPPWALADAPTGPSWAAVLRAFRDSRLVWSLLFDDTRGST